MSKNLHIICAKCGSTDFQYYWDNQAFEVEETDTNIKITTKCGCTIVCHNCSALTLFEDLINA